MNSLILVAKGKDAAIIKQLINEMYGSEYEKREISQIEESIENRREIYTLAFEDDLLIGFAGASTQSEEYLDVTQEVRTVIDYVYIKKSYRGFIYAYKLIKKLVAELVDNQINSAIMQVQTYNKQRFFHYALSDKNIIKCTKCSSKGKDYEDQILLIKDLKKVLQMDMKDILTKVEEYKTIEK